MLREVGVKFQFQGGSQAQSEMKSLAGGFKDLHREAQQSAGGIKSAFSSILTGISIGATIAAMEKIGDAFKKLIMLPREMAGMTKEYSGKAAMLRSLGLDDATMAELKKRHTEISNMIPGISKAQAAQSQYDITSAFSDIDKKKAAQVTQDMLMMSKSTLMSPEEAAKAAASYWAGIPSQQRKNMDPEKTMQDWAAMYYSIVKGGKVKGPELFAGATHALPYARMKGWDDKYTHSLLGHFIGSGVSGEEAGTFVKNMITHAEGYGKVLAHSDPRFTQQRQMMRLHGQAKKQAEEMNKWLELEYTEQGQNISKDPMLMMKRQKAAVDQMKRMGVDPDSIVTKAYGVRGAGGIIKGLQDLPQLENIYKTTKGAKFGDVEEAHHNMLKEYSEQADLYSQRLNNMKGSIGSLFVQGDIARMERWGNAFQAVTLMANGLLNDTVYTSEEVNQKLFELGGEPLVALYSSIKNVYENALKPFFEGVAEGFVKAFGGDVSGGFIGVIQQVVDWLGKLNKDDGAKWGNEFASSLQTVASALKNILDLITAIGNNPLTSFLLKHLGGMHQKELESARKSVEDVKKIPELPGKIWEGAKENLNDAFGWLWPYLSPSNNAGIGMGTAIGGLFGGRSTVSPLSRLFGLSEEGVYAQAPENLGGPFRSSGFGYGDSQPNISVNPSFDVRVMVGNTELKDLVVEIIQNELSRQRYGADDAAVGGGYLL
jgi:hypothetical protein